MRPNIREFRKAEIQLTIHSGQERRRLVEAGEPLKVYPVILGRYPRWLPNRVREAIRKGLVKRPPPPCKYFIAAEITKVTGPSIWDHWGVCQNDPDLLVTEPYTTIDYEDTIKAAERFAKLFNLEYLILPQSNWNPPGTIRIEFWPSMASIAAMP